MKPFQTIDVIQQYMEQALDLARRGMREGLGGPFGALVVKEGQVIGSGCNRVLADMDPTAHAEITAIRHACRTLGTFQLQDCEIYCTCEPCPMCLGAIYWARPRCVYYAYSKEDAAHIGFDDAFIYQELHQEPDLRRIPMQAVHTSDQGALFEEWLHMDHKTLY